MWWSCNTLFYQLSQLGAQVLIMRKNSDIICRGGIHKKLAGSKKSEESSTCFFQNLCLGTKTKVRSGCRRSPPLPPSSPILSIPFSSEIDPLGIYRLTFLRHARGSCFTVARGQHSRVRLWSRNHDLCISQGTFYAKSCKIPCTMIQFWTRLWPIVSLMMKDAVTPSEKTALSSQDPFVVVGRRRRCWSLSAPVSGTAITLTPPLLLTTTTTKSTETDRGLCLRLPPMMSRGARGASDAAGGDNNWRGAGDSASVCWRRAHRADDPRRPPAEDPLS